MGLCVISWGLIPPTVTWHEAISFAYFVYQHITHATLVCCWWFWRYMEYVHHYLVAFYFYWLQTIPGALNFLSAWFSLHLLHLWELMFLLLFQCHLHLNQLPLSCGPLLLPGSWQRWASCLIPLQLCSHWIIFLHGRRPQCSSFLNLGSVFALVK